MNLFDIELILPTRHSPELALPDDPTHHNALIVPPEIGLPGVTAALEEAGLRNRFRFLFPNYSQAAIRYWVASIHPTLSAACRATTVYVRSKNTQRALDAGFPVGNVVETTHLMIRLKGAK